MTESRFDKLADKAPTDLHERFAEWIEEQTGYEPDLKTVQLACVLRIDFQRSDENQAVLEERQKAAEQRELDRVQKAADRDAKKAAEADKAEKAEARKAAKKSAAPKKAAKAAEPEVEEEDEEDEPVEKPVVQSRRRRPAPAKAEPVETKSEPVSRRRRRPAPGKTTTKAAAVGEDFDEDDLG